MTGGARSTRTVTIIGTDSSPSTSRDWTQTLRSPSGPAASVQGSGPSLAGSSVDASIQADQRRPSFETRTPSVAAGPSYVTAATSTFSDRPTGGSTATLATTGWANTWPTSAG